MAKRSGDKLATSQRQKWQRLLHSSGKAGQPAALKVLIDTNVWYSAVLYNRDPEKLIRYCLGNCQVIISEYILDELFALLKLKVAAPYRWRNALRRQLEERCLVVDISQAGAQEVRDIKDIPVMQAAIVAEVDIVISGDEDLLELSSTKPKVLNTQQFLKEVGL